MYIVVLYVNDSIEYLVSSMIYGLSSVLFCGFGAGVVQGYDAITHSRR